MIGLGTIINKYSGGSHRRIAGTGSEKGMPERMQDALRHPVF